MNDDVSVVIPGAKNRQQAEDNARASSVDALSDETQWAWSSAWACAQAL
jgi:aryl-alcohol dehydrogenase-like predicted oxidoreductase